MSCRLIQESPRWLIVKGKEKQANDVIQFIAECNHKDIPDPVDFGTEHEDTEKVHLVIRPLLIYVKPILIDW